MRTKLEIIDYIKAYMKEKEVSKKELGELLGATGLTQQKIQKANQFLNYKNSKIDLDHLLIISKRLGLSIEQILLKDREIKKHISEIKDFHLNEQHLVPLIKNDATASDSPSEQQIESWVSVPFVKKSKKHIAVYVSDDSIKGLNKGDIAFIDTRIQNYALDKKVVLATFDGKSFLRRFERNNSETIVLSSDNSDPDLEFDLDSDLIVIGPVVWHLSSFCSA